jgi:hypothetical protein
MYKVKSHKDKGRWLRTKGALEDIIKSKPVSLKDPFKHKLNYNIGDLGNEKCIL